MNYYKPPYLKKLIANLKKSNLQYTLSLESGDRIALWVPGLELRIIFQGGLLQFAILGPLRSYDVVRISGFIWHNYQLSMIGKKFLNFNLISTYQAFTIFELNEPKNIKMPAYKVAA